jgi:TonB-linked SusC/RagA family outer membrane protein
MSMNKLLTLVCALVISLSVMAQTSITGTILDDKGNPVPFASVNIKNSKAGTRADEKGNFSISASAGQTLIVSALNYTSQEVPISGSAPITVHLVTASDQTLNEVVVTALGVKREKRSLTYATQTVGSDELNKSGTGNPLSELQGKASGLTVINSAGDPGAGTYIRLRGVTSITGDNQPLIVVDGIPIDNSINNYDPTSATPNVSGAAANLTGGTQPTNRGIDINPNDIESVTVLKGPAATALYGIKAASGALIISTKKGTLGEQKMRVDFNSTTGWSEVNKVPELQDKYSQGSNGVYYGSTSGNGGRRTTWGALIDTLSWDGNGNIWDPHGNIVGKSDPSAKIPVTPYDRYNFFGTGVLMDNNVSVSGGSATAGFRTSIGNVHQTGVIPNAQYNKTTFSLSGLAKLTDKFNVSGSVTYINSANDKIQQGSNTSGVMLGLVRTPPTFDNSFGLSDPAHDERAYVVAETGEQRNYRGGGASYDNPYWTVNRNPFHELMNRVLGNFQAAYQFADWISASWRFGGDVYGQDAKNFYDINSNAFPNGLGIINEYFNSQYNSDLTVNLKKNFSDDFSGSLLLGHNYFYNTTHSRLVTGNTLIVPTFFDISNALAYTSTEADAQKRTMAFYGEANLSYKNMLFLDLTGRRETSSSLPVNNRDFFYPSAGATWVFTELPFFKTSDVLSYGKLRLSYAQVGKDAPVQGLQTYYSPSLIADGFTPGDFFPINSNGVPIGSYQITSTISVIGNPDLKPEKTNSYEGGVDLGFFRNRLNVTGTYYSSKTNDAILTVPLAYTTGFSAKLFNAGVITNKGFELTLNATPVKSKSFSWDMTINWSTNKNMVESLAPGVDKILIAGFTGGEIDAFAGKPFGQIFGGIYVRANPGTIKNPNDLPGGPLLINDDKTSQGYGMPIVSTQNAIIGDINPKWIGTFLNTLRYKGITLGFQIDVRKGGDLWNGTRGAISYFGTSKETENRGQSVTFQGLSGHLNTEGQVVHYDANGNEAAGPGAANTAATTYNQYYWQNIGSSFIGPSEPDVEDGSFIKLHEASIGYSFPPSMLGKTFTNLSITFVANNIILHTKYTGVDPETSLAGPANGQGLDYFNNPGVKNYGIRLNIGLQ